MGKAVDHLDTLTVSHWFFLIGCFSLAISHCLFLIGYFPLAVSRWLLVFSHFSLAVSHWPFLTGCFSLATYYLLLIGCFSLVVLLLLRVAMGLMPHVLLPRKSNLLKNIEILGKLCHTRNSNRGSMWRLYNEPQKYPLTGKSELS